MKNDDWGLSIYEPFHVGGIFSGYALEHASVVLLVTDECPHREQHNGKDELHWYGSRESVGSRAPTGYGIGSAHSLGRGRRRPPRRGASWRGRNPTKAKAGMLCRPINRCTATRPVGQEGDYGERIASVVVFVFSSLNGGRIQGGGADVMMPRSTTA